MSIHFSKNYAGNKINMKPVALRELQWTNIIHLDFLSTLRTTRRC